MAGITRRLLMVLVLGAAVAVLGLVPAERASCAPAPASALRVAKQHTSSRLRVIELYSVFSVRSKRDSRWALVDGFYRRPWPGGTWAVWLRLRGGRWTVVHAGRKGRAINPPASAGVPCDIRPAFSRPSC